jgi:hypothetical protein
MKKITVLFLAVLLISPLFAQQKKTETKVPVRGFCIAAPHPAELDAFLEFIHDVLGPAGVNALVLRVDYNYQYKSHPELQDEDALSPVDAERIVQACRNQGIAIIPQVNLLGHQSWASDLGNLLKVYPQFDETPDVKLPKKYEWPNQDSLYCKSYCPLHPGVHRIVFDVVDEIVSAFHAKAFHAGMDEVFYIGDPDCPRCAGKSKAKLFADEVRRIDDHLATTGTELWIWGDRLIDGKTSGIGMWEGSENHTWPAVDLIPKDVVICDWHYERAVPTAPYFAQKGLHVISCPWRKPEVALQQLRDMRNFRQQSPSPMNENFMGVMLTVWSPAENFLRRWKAHEKPLNGMSDIACFKALSAAWIVK